MLSVFLALALLAGMLPAVAVQAEDASVYDADCSVTLPEGGVVAEVLLRDGDETKTVSYKLDGTTATREAVNKQLAKAWQTAVSKSEDEDNRLAATEKYNKRVEMHLYVDWYAVDGKFGSGDAFDGGELELDGNNSQVLLDLHGHTLDRGSDSSNKYGRVIDFQGSNKCSLYLVSSGGVKGTIRGGWDDIGGAIRIDNFGPLYMENIIVEDNHSERGAVCFNEASDLTAVDCIFRNNQASENGGAISCNIIDAFTIDLTDCVFYGNSAQKNGGAIYLENTDSVFEYSLMTNCVLYENYAGKDGGGIYLECDAVLTLEGDSRVYENRAVNEGGGIFLESYANDDALVKVGGTTAVYSNLASDPAVHSDIHLDTGSTSAAKFDVLGNFDPIRPSGIYAEETSQTVATYKGSEDLDQETVNRWFFSDRDDFYLKADGKDVEAKKLSSDSRIGDLLSFTASVSAPEGSVGLKPASVQIDNDRHAVSMTLPALADGDAQLLAKLAVTDGSVVALPGQAQADDGVITLDLEKIGENYRGYFEIRNAEQTALYLWTVYIAVDRDLSEDVLMTVFDGTNTPLEYTEENGGFEAGWAEAIRKVKTSKNITVTLHRDWVAEDGSFGEGEGFSDGRIAVGYNTTASLTLDLNGCSIDRGLTQAKSSGQVLRIGSNSKFKITNSADCSESFITGGYNDGCGGGIYMVGSAELTLENVAIVGNRCTENGGGIYHKEDSVLTLLDGAVIEANTAVLTNGPTTKGGGICSADSADLTVGSGSEIRGNHAGIGGGICWNSDGRLDLISCSITENTALKNGGGVYAYSSDTSDPYLGGTLCITDNTVNDAADNLALHDEEANLNQNTGTNLSGSAMIGVNMVSGIGSDGKDCITASGSKFSTHSSRYFVSDDPEYTIVADDDGDGDNKYQIHLLRDSKLSDDELTEITGASFGMAVEDVQIDTDAKTVRIAVDPALYLTYQNIALTSLTHNGSLLLPEYDTAKDYTVPQSYTVIAKNGFTAQTWTVQAVPDSDEWKQFELKVRGGSTERNFYYCGEEATITVDDDDYTFVSWTIVDNEGTRTVSDRTYTFTMPASMVVATVNTFEKISRISVVMDNVLANGVNTFADIDITAVHNADDGEFKPFTPVWLNGAASSPLDSTAVIEQDRSYYVMLALEPAVKGNEFLSESELNADVDIVNANGDLIGRVTPSGYIENGILYLYIPVASGKGAPVAATVNVTDTDGNAIPSDRYSLSNNGDLYIGEVATFTASDYTQDGVYYKVNSVSGISDISDTQDGIQFKVTETVNIVVDYTTQTLIDSVWLTTPTVTAGNALPSEVSVISQNVTAGEITWTPNDAQAGYYTSYTGTVTLTPDDGYFFNYIIDVAISGRILSAMRLSDGTAVAKFTVTSNKDVVTSVTDPADIAAELGKVPSLPASVAVTTAGGSLNGESVGVTWTAPDNFDMYTAGTYTFIGTLQLPDHVDADGKYASVNVIIADKPAAPTKTLTERIMDGAEAGTQVLGTELTLESAVEDALIYYTLDTDEAPSFDADGNPIGATVLYTAPLTFNTSGSHTVKAVTVKTGALISDTAEFSFSVDAKRVYTLIARQWADGVYTEIDSFSTFEGDWVTVTAENYDELCFLGWNLEIVTGSFTPNMDRQISFQMPQLSGTDYIDAIYISYADEVSISDLDAPEDGQPLDTSVDYSVVFDFAADAAGSENYTVSGTAAVSWTDENGSAVTDAADGETYTAQIVIESDLVQGLVFSDNVPISVLGITDAEAVRASADDDGNCIITFTVSLGGASASVTEKPVIVYDEDTFTVEAEGDGEVIVYVDGDEVTNPYTFTQGAADETYLVTATAQEVGKQISEEAELTVCVPAAGSTQPVPTDAPVIVYNADTFTVEAMGDGEVIVYVDGDEVTNPYTFARSLSEQTYFVTATAQEEGKQVSVPSELTVTVPPITADPDSIVVIFDANGGSVTPDFAIADDEGKLDELPTPTRSDAAFFLGWYTEEDGGRKITLNTVFTETTTVYAHWFDFGGGGSGSGGSGGGSGSGGSGGSGGSSSSGSSSSSSYTITIEDSRNGEVFSNKRSAVRGATVTLTVEADSGYTLETLTVTDRKGNEIDLNSRSEDEFTFKMPASKVTVEATFMEDNTMLNYFVDVFASDYYYDAVLWAAENGIATGTDPVHFSPDLPCTRAQAVTFLHRAVGAPEPKTETMPFADVAADSYYYDAVLWAVENGITTGTSASAFSPDAVCTRAQIVTFIYRTVQSAGGGFTGTWMFRLPFTDAPDWAYEAIAWCYKEGITTGTADTTFSPDANCTRAQIVTFLYRAQLPNTDERTLTRE